MINWQLDKHLESFPHAALTITDSRVYGIWVIGNSYKRVENYYGEYPPTFVNRVMTLLPDNLLTEKTLHLFSGSVKKRLANEVLFDSNPDVGADVVGDAENLSSYFSADEFGLVMADPPYSSEDAKHYGFKMPRTHLVMRGLASICKKGALVVWLCTRPPIYSSEHWFMAGIIGVYTGTNRVFRATMLFERI